MSIKREKRDPEIDLLLCAFRSRDGNSNRRSKTQEMGQCYASYAAIN